MKNLFLSLVLVMVGLVANSQVITVNIHTVQNFEHSSSISTVQAMKLDSIEYPSYIVGENVYTFDLDKKVFTFKGDNGGFFSTKIVKINRNVNVVDCVIFDGVSNVLFVVGLTDIGEQQFLMERVVNNKVVGQFSMNSDFNYTIK